MFRSAQGIEGQERNGIVNKEYKVQRIFQRLGNVSQNDAEAWLSARQAEIDAQRADALRSGGQRLWADAARKYLMECQTRKVRTLHLISFHVQLLLHSIGALPLRQVCNESLEQFRLGRKNWTINRSLEVARSTLIGAARVKVNRKHVMILNDVAWSIVEARRGKHDKYVFTYAAPGHAPGRVATMNSAAFQKARTDLGLPMVRVHDLETHLRAAAARRRRERRGPGIAAGHAIEGMPRHYATAAVARLVEAANNVANTRDRTTLLRVVND